MTYSEDCILYVKRNQKKIVAEYCDIKQFTPSINPMSLFMAGSPGSGKTEYSSNFVKSWEKEHPVAKILRLDTDELRKLIPGYTGANSDEVQKSCSILLDKMQDYVLKNNQSVFIDGTFSSPRSIENVYRHIRHGRTVGIIYLYQNPLIAWEYTKKRERLEGRTVPKDAFIRGYVESRENVNKVKAKFGEKIHLDLIIKSSDNSFSNTQFNVKNVNFYLKDDKYTPKLLEELLRV